MRISRFDEAFDNEPKHEELTWEEFCDWFEDGHTVTSGTKREQPGFSPAEYEDGAVRGVAGVVRVHLLVLDIDKVKARQRNQIVELLDSEELAFVLYTTWSHKLEDKLWRFRVCIPLSRPVACEHWKRFWLRANQYFGGLMDPQTKDPSRFFFGPLIPEEADPAVHEVIVQQDGHVLDVDDVLNMPLLTSEEPVRFGEQRESLSAAAFKKFAKKLERSSKEYDQELGALLTDVSEGKPFAGPGERDTTLFKLAQRLGPHFLKYAPEAIAEHFEKSLAVMRRAAPDGALEPSDVESKLRRAQEGAEVERLEKEEQRAQEAKDRIKVAFSDEREDPYTREELQDVENQSWIVDYKSRYYVRLGDQYKGPFRAESAKVAVHRYLAPAGESGAVDLYRFNKDGDPTPRMLPALMAEYGTFVQKVAYEYCREKAELDRATETLILPTAPFKKVRAVFHDDVHKWLEKMAAAKFELLLRWLSALPNIERPCVTLFLTGMKGTGKSFLALNSAQTWNSAPTPLHLVFDNFNSAMLNNPLCFADEQLPKDIRGYVKNAELRHEIQNLTRMVNIKNEPAVELRGATRIIVAANNEDVLMTGESLTEEDIHAISERYLHIPCNPKAARFLEKQDTFRWIAEDRVVEHIWWLHENMDWEPDGRFLIKDPDDESLVRSLSVRSGGRSSLAEWLVNYLRRPEDFNSDAKSDLLVRVKDGQLLVNVKGISLGWGIYVPQEKTPATYKLMRDLKSLLVDNKRVKASTPDGRINYYVVDIRSLKEWAKVTNLMTPEEIDKALQIDTEKRIALTEKTKAARKIERAKEGRG